MTTSQTLNIIGLLFDISGVVLLFLYGLPPEGELNKEGQTLMAFSQIDENIKSKWKKFSLRSKIGLAFLILGFLFQGLSTMWISIASFFACTK